MKFLKRMLCFSLFLLMMFETLAGHRAESVSKEQTIKRSSVFEKAVEIGIAWEELAYAAEEPILWPVLIVFNEAFE